ncbi:uncharacterized protein LOC144713115 [Wolffia australiana]
MKTANKPAMTKPAGLVVVRGPLFTQDLGRKGDDTLLCLAITLDIPTDPPVAPRQPEIEALVSEFGDAFPDELPGGLPPMRNIQHAIDLVPSTTLPNLPHYRMEPQKYVELLRQLRDLLEKGLIQESLSPCTVPALLATKKDGTRFVVVYFDDILIYSRLTEECLDHLRQVCIVLRREQLYAHPKKCSFVTSEIAFLGFIVSAQGLAADPEKVRVITSWPSPANLHDFFSEKLNDAKLRYSTYDKEFYAIVQDYTFVIKYKKGKDNIVTNVLSRRAHVLNAMKVTVLRFETIREGYDNCPDFGPIIAEVRRGRSHDHRDYVITDGYLFYWNRLCLSHTSLRDFLTWECHVGGLSDHFGRDKTIAAVEYQFYWPSLKRDVGNIVAQCRVCALAK